MYETFIELRNAYHAATGVKNAVELRVAIPNDILDSNRNILLYSCMYLERYESSIAYTAGGNDILTKLACGYSLDAIAAALDVDSERLGERLLAGNYLVTAYLLNNKALGLIGSDTVTTEDIYALIDNTFDAYNNAHPDKQLPFGMRVKTKSSLYRFYHLYKKVFDALLIAP